MFGKLDLVTLISLAELAYLLRRLVDGFELLKFLNPGVFESSVAYLDWLEVFISLVHKMSVILPDSLFLCDLIIIAEFQRIASTREW